MSYEIPVQNISFERFCLLIREVPVGIAKSTYNRGATEQLAIGVRQLFDQVGMSNVIEAEAPGAMELPIVSLGLAKVGCAIVVACAIVVQGETDHYRLVADACSNGLNSVSITYEIPIGNAVLTGPDYVGLLSRSAPDEGNRGGEAALAAVKTLHSLYQIGAWSPEMYQHDRSRT